MLTIVYNNVIFKNNEYIYRYNESGISIESEILIIDEDSNLLGVAYIPVEYTKNEDIFTKECKILYEVYCENEK